MEIRKTKIKKNIGSEEMESKTDKVFKNLINELIADININNKSKAKKEIFMQSRNTGELYCIEIEVKRHDLY